MAAKRKTKTARTRSPAKSSSRRTTRGRKSSTRHRTRGAQPAAQVEPLPFGHVDVDILHKQGGQEPVGQPPKDAG